MNILLMSLLYPNDQMDEVARYAKDKLQNQINSYQRAFEQGIRQNLKAGERLDILNSLPVGIFPLQYKKLVLHGGMHDDNTIQQLGCINLPWLKQRMRACAAGKALLNWAQASTENRTVLVYTQYLPYMQAVAKVKKRFPDLKTAVIVTDLPKELGLPSGRKGLLKALEYRMGDESLRLCREMDGFVLLTAPMAEALCISKKPFEVIEGLILSDLPNLPTATPTQTAQPIVLYSGTLERALGIDDLLEAFACMPEYDLWICGRGGMEQEVKTAAEKHSNIRYFGFLPQKEALALQAQASALVNPRRPDATFTRYSFPSKTLEYMRSGKPVLCCRLDGIPRDYDPYLCYMKGEGAESICQAVHELMALPPEQRTQLGSDAREYVIAQKNPRVQCERLLSLLRRM